MSIFDMGRFSPANTALVAGTEMHRRIAAALANGAAFEEIQAPPASRSIDDALEFMGVDAICSPYLPETKHVQFRFPRSKKKRIRKKWRKNAANWRDDHVVYFMDMKMMRKVDFPKSCITLRNLSL